MIGRADDVREAFYAITVERRLRHPAVVSLAEAARDALFGAALTPDVEFPQLSPDISRWTGYPGRHVLARCPEATT